MNVPPDQTAPPFLDRLLEAEEAAQWLGLTVRALKDRTRSGKLPVVKLSYTKRRWHPRSILKALAAETPNL